MVFANSRALYNMFTTLQTTALTTFHQRWHLLAVFFDIRKAFDMTWRRNILMKLQEWSFRGRLSSFTSFFLSARTYHTRVGPVQSRELRLEMGFHKVQFYRHPCSNNTISDINNYIEKPVQYLLFVDDLVISLPCSDLTLGQATLQSIVNKLQQWSNRSGFQLSTEKSRTVRVK